MSGNLFSWDGPTGYSYDNSWDPAGYSGSDFDFGGLSALDDSQWYSGSSWLDKLSGGLEKGVGALGTVWDKLNAGSGANGAGPSLLSQLGTLGVGGLSAYANYDAYRDANDIAKEKMAQDYAIRQADLELNRDKFGFSKEVSAQDYGLRQAELGLSRDTNMLNQQAARVNAADNLSKTSAVFDLIKKRQGVDLGGNLKPYTDQLASQGWTPDYGLAPVTSTLSQFGTTSRPQLPPALANTRPPAAQTQAFSSDRAYAFAHGGVMPRGGAAQGALGLLAGGTAGQDDSINARLSDGEYVMDADIVAALGDGNTAAGAKKLDQMRENIRRHKRSASHDSIPPRAKSIEAYLRGGRK